MTGIASVLNALAPSAARDALLRCCGSRRFAESVAAGRPFADDDSVMARVESVESALDDGDWLEAFAAHPRIGAKRVESVWSRDEQSGVDSADSDVARALADGNRRYDDRFGHVFLIAASGLDAETILAALERRLANDAGTELREAAREQRKITRMRLTKLVREIERGRP